MRLCIPEFQRKHTDSSKSVHTGPPRQSDSPNAFRKRLLRRSLCGRPMTQGRLLLRLHFGVSSPRCSTRAVVRRAARAHVASICASEARWCGSCRDNKWARTRRTYARRSSALPWLCKQHGLRPGSAAPLLAPRPLRLRHRAHRALSRLLRVKGLRM